MYLFKGYAGTGKSTLIGHLVKSLVKPITKPVLMAPTGRAAKVIANYSNKKALQFTNKFIYQTEKGSGVQVCIETK